LQLSKAGTGYYAIPGFCPELLYLESISSMWVFIVQRFPQQVCPDPLIQGFLEMWLHCIFMFHFVFIF